MPAYGDNPGPTGTGVGASGQSATALQPGDSLILFNAETPGAGERSLAIARAIGPTADDVGTTFSVLCTSAPTAGDFLIQAANTDAPVSYQTVYTATTGASQNYTDVGRWKYYSILWVAHPQVVTAIASR